MQEHPVRYQSSIDVIKSVYRIHGLRAIFRGTSATLMRDLFYGHYFAQYEWTKRKFIGDSTAASTKALACALAVIHTHTHTHLHTHTLSLTCILVCECVYECV